jgi:hypothetical protein
VRLAPSPIEGRFPPIGRPPRCRGDRCARQSDVFQNVAGMGKELLPDQRG